MLLLIFSVTASIYNGYSYQLEMVNRLYDFDFKEPEPKTPK